MGASSDRSAPGPAWRPREIAAAAFFVAFLAVMIALPLVQLRIAWGTRGIGRFGWQMYAHESTRPDFIAWWPDGGTRPIRSRRVSPWWWADFGYRDALARELCGDAAGAVRITVAPPYPSRPGEEYACP